MIKVYSAPNCPNCDKVKTFLKQKKIEFEEINIAGNIEAIKMIKEKTGMVGVPVTQINNEFILGWNKEKLEAATK